jgi:hypothetical protein
MTGNTCGCRERERERELQFNETNENIVQQSDTHTHK